MNCRCDEFIFPPQTEIAAGLTHLHRQTGTFAEFRRALLRAASIRSTAALDAHPLWSARYLTERDRASLARTLLAIGAWRGRHPQDFGVMLFEMWAYVCDLTSLYDDVIAHELYVRTSRRRDSLRKLVEPLGYIPRPAVAALAELAAFAEGRKAVVLPVGTAFRSGAFDGNPPQVFEVTTPATIHPLLNEWTLQPVRPNLMPTGNTNFVLCKPGTVTVKPDDVVLLVLGVTTVHALRVAAVEDYDSPDASKYVKVRFTSNVNIGPNTAYGNASLWKSTSIATQWKRTVGGELGYEGANKLYLDSVNRQIRKGQRVVLQDGTAMQANIVEKNDDASRTITAAGTVTFTPDPGTPTDVTVPAVTAPVSKLTLSYDIQGTVLDGSPHIDIHYGFVPGGAIVAEAKTELARIDPKSVKTPVEMPRDASAPGEFQLEDKNGLGIGRPGTLNFANGAFTVQGDPWPQTLVAPVRLFGNIVPTSRGETVNGEFLGAGDSATPNQSFTLKKKPLTYLPSPSTSTPSRLTSTLSVYVDGLRWSEVPSFYGHGGEEEIYTVRQNDKNESVVTFGDGILGRRLSTGASVMAYYRHGAGAAMPPAGSITQLAKPVMGLKSVRGPVAPYGGADAEPADSLQKFAPRSALLLGRAVSLPDLEAAAASYAGVRAVAAEWRWSTELQVPAAHIWYLADGDLTELLLTELRSITQPDTPIKVERAIAQPALLWLQLQHDPRRFEDDVVDAARAALVDTETGLLAPERLGIGKPLFRSRLFEFLLDVEGVESVTSLYFGFSPFSEYGVKPQAGHYFDFTNLLYINGRFD
jgi:hypothetical protein